MTRPEKCQECQKICKTEAHHEDYTRPLMVQWFCKICHGHKHDKLMDIK